MKRILTVLAVALVMAMMFVAMAMPAFAKITEQTTNPAGNVNQGSAAPTPPDNSEREPCGPRSSGTESVRGSNENGYLSGSRSCIKTGESETGKEVKKSEAYPSVSCSSFHPGGDGGGYGCSGIRQDYASAASVV